MTYQDQIKSPKWQKKRLEVLEKNKFKCEDCGDKDSQLHVHHAYYQKNHKIWEYENYLLRCLCDSCHAKTHEIQQRIIEAIGVLEIVAVNGIKDQILGYLHGLAGPPSEPDPSENYMQGYIDAQEKYNLSEQYMRAKQQYEEGYK